MRLWDYIFKYGYHIITLCTIFMGVCHTTNKLFVDALSCWRLSHHRPGVLMPSAQYPLPAPRISLNPSPHAISINSTSGLGGKCIPEPALGPKAAALSISTEPPARSCTAPHTISTPRTSGQAVLLPLRLLPQFWPVDWGGWLVPSQPLNLKLHKGTCAFITGSNSME